MTTTPQPPEDPSLPDDVWEKFSNDSEASIRATAPKEPSARARMVTRRLRDEDEQARLDGLAPARPPKRSFRERRAARRAGFDLPRTRRTPRKPRTPRKRRAFRISQAPRAPRTRREPRRGGSFLDRWRTPIVVVLTLSIGLLVLNPMETLSWLPGIGDSSGSSQEPEPTPGPQGSPSSSVGPRTPESAASTPPSSPTAVPTMPHQPQRTETPAAQDV